ncbi:nuclear transport factor 2 family protein [Prevotella sp. 10(H)]|uniref:nuclear transport factor 2 family protein n=1 Tax=Prevotella sp. 10(H) TaxID=1158294 RepID=UPI0004A75292|nr:nuclear transport factor 2 family protein [Prevotella sp. 10(H)]
MKTILLIILSCFVFSCKNSETHNSVNKQDIEKEAWNTVRNINRHWAITEDMDSLSMFIHPDMVLISPDGTTYGKDSIIQAYRKYAEYAETISMEETEPMIHLYNDNKTAIVNYKNTLKIRTATDEIQSFSCRDLYTLIFENNKWIAVAQHYSFIKN